MAKKKKPVAKKKAAKKAAPKKKAGAKKPKKAAKPAKVAAKPAKPVKVAKPRIEIPKKPSLISPKNKTQYTQSELYDALTGYCGFTSRKIAKEFYAQFSSMIQTALKSGYKIALPGLGKIQVRKTKARMGINPKTREPIKISAKRKVRFTPNKALKDAVL